MANLDHLNVLARGPDAWNHWRMLNPDVIPDLTGADLSSRSLSLQYLPGALSAIDLTKADLSEALLEGSSLRYAILDGAKLSSIRGTGIDLNHASMRDATLVTATLRGANLADADFESADLSGAILVDADMWGARLAYASLAAADLTNAFLGAAILAETKLSGAVGLEHIRFGGECQVSLQTLIGNYPHLPDTFLRGVGVPETLLTYWRSLTVDPIELYSCFISYSSIDSEFVGRLYEDLRARSVRVWYAPEDLHIGDHLRPRIDESIRLHDKLLLVLSEHSIASQWVEQEVETALEKERLTDRTALFPIRLDEAALQSQQGWAALLRRTRHIGDFSHWREPDAYNRSLARLVNDLRRAPSGDDSDRTLDS